MSTKATYIGPNQFSIAGSRTGEYSASLRVLADCQVDGLRLGSVTEASYADGITIVTMDIDDGAVLTANLASVRHSAVGLNSLPRHASLHAADGPDFLGAADIGAATAEGLLAETASRQAHEAAGNPHAGSASTAALDAAVALLVPETRAVNATFPVQGGGGLDADRAFTLALAVVSELLTYGVTLTGKVVTDQILAACTKLLVNANTTIYVATTGSDATGTGAVGAPFASIAKALSSLAGKLIATGVAVTIQLADGTYNIASAIVVDHPDADKIQILGNTSAETALTVASIDTAAKKFTISGDQTAVKGTSVGDVLALPNGTAGNRGLYTIVSATYTGGNTEIVVAETIASDTPGGATLIAKPSNRCVLLFASGVNGFSITKSAGQIEGFRVESAGGASPGGFMVYYGANALIRQKNVIKGWRYGIFPQRNGLASIYGPAIKDCASGIYADTCGAAICYTNPTVVDGSTVMAVTANGMSHVKLSSLIILGSHNTSDYSPAINTVGNANSYISST